MSTRWWSSALALSAAVLVVALGSPMCFGQSEKPGGGGKEAGKATGKEAAKPESPPMPAQQRIERMLEEVTTDDVDEMPLNQLLAYLSEAHKIPIQIDRKALEAVGIDTDVPVTFHAKGIRLRSALNVICRQLDLAYAVHDEVLLVTSADAAGQLLDTKVYDVADLVVFQDENGHRWEDFDALVDVIRSTACPQSWAESGGAGQIRSAHLGEANVLVIAQTYEIHRQIARLLEELRQISRKNPTPAEPPVRPRPALGPMKGPSGGAMMGGMGGMMGPAGMGMGGMGMGGMGAGGMGMSPPGMGMMGPAGSGNQPSPGAGTKRPPK